MVGNHRYGNRCIPLIIDDKKLVNIDKQEDLAAAERLLQDNEMTLDFLKGI